MRLRRPRSTGALLFLFIFGVYLLLMSGHTYSPDEETLLATSTSLIERGTFALERNSTQVQVPGANGQLYSQYGPGQPVAALPFALLGVATGDWILDLDSNGEGYVLRFFAGIFNPLIAAGLCVLFWATLLLLGCGRRLALLLTLLLAFATYLWPHSRTFFGEPLTAFCLLLSFYLLLKIKIEQPTDRRLILYSLLAGAALAATVAVKVQYVVALPALGLYGLWVAYQLKRNGVRLVGGMAAGGVVIALLLMLYNWSAFGNPISTGYGADLQGTFKTPLYEGLFGLLFSSGKGLWLYAPPLFLGLIGYAPFFRRHRAEALLVVGLSMPVLLLFSVYRFWPGDGSWGPRYLAPLLPFLLLPAAGLLFPNPNAVPTDRRWLRPPRVALLIFGVWGLAVNLLGVAVNFDTYINVVNDDGTRYWYPETSPVRGHWVILNQRIEEWRCRIGLCPDAALLLEGFSYSEGDKFLNDLFPRWTHGHATIGLPAETVTLTMLLADHRPPPLPRAEVTLTATGGQVTAQTRVPVPDSPVESVLTATIQPATSARPTLIIDIPPWNPHEVAGSARDEELGLMVEKMAVYDAAGQKLEIQESLGIDPMYPAPRWYYNPQSHYPLDLWISYLDVAGLPRRAGITLALVVLIPALLALGFSIRPLWRQLAAP